MKEGEEEEPWEEPDAESASSRPSTLHMVRNADEAGRSASIVAARSDWRTPQASEEERKKIAGIGGSSACANEDICLTCYEILPTDRAAQRRSLITRCSSSLKQLVAEPSSCDAAATEPAVTPRQALRRSTHIADSRVRVRPLQSTLGCPRRLSVIRACSRRPECLICSPEASAGGNSLQVARGRSNRSDAEGRPLQLQTQPRKGRSLSSEAKRPVRLQLHHNLPGPPSHSCWTVTLDSSPR